MADLVERVEFEIRRLIMDDDYDTWGMARSIILLIEADMKERCAKVAEQRDEEDDWLVWPDGDEIAAAIRSMKGTLDD